MNPRLIVIMLFLVGSVMSSGCSRRTVIDSVPPGADIRINGQYLGRTPVNVRISGSTWMGGQMQVEASLDGYRTVTGPLDWAYDPRHLYLLPFVIIPITQLAHAYPSLHRRPLGSYTIVLEEDLGEGLDRRPRIHGTDDVAAARWRGTE